MINKSEQTELLRKKMIKRYYNQEFYWTMQAVLIINILFFGLCIFLKNGTPMIFSLICFIAGFFERESKIHYWKQVNEKVGLHYGFYSFTLLEFDFVIRHDETGNETRIEYKSIKYIMNVKDTLYVLLTNHVLISLEKQNFDTNLDEVLLFFDVRDIPIK